MPLLEALLALALTLLSLAMIATLIVEMIHRIFGTRAKNLRAMLEKFYDKALKKILKNEQPEDGKKLEGKDKLIDKLMTNPLIKTKKEEQAGSSKLLIKVFTYLPKSATRYIDNKRLKDIGSLSPEDLFKGLASTNLGKQIKKKTEAEIDEIVDSLSQSYDEIGVAATDLFKRRAQIISLVIGVVVAFVFNANAFRIYESYMNDPQARAKAVARADAVLENFSKKTENLRNVDNSEGYKNTNELVKDVNSIRDEINNLGYMGIPIGYSKDEVPLIWFVKNSASEPNETASERNEFDCDWWPGIIFWSFGVFGTGLLIGLGGPFWFNVVRKLTDTLQVIRGGTPAAAGAGGSAGGLVDPMKTNRDTFKMTGGLPQSVKAQAKLTVANKAATDADKAVKAAADALMGVKNAAGNNPNDLMKAAVEDAEKALKIATDTQRKMYENKREAEQPK